MVQKAANQIDANQWTLFDKIMYGGLGYGSFCLPSDFFKVIISIIFPPLGELINIVEDTVSDSFPYFTWDTLVMLCSYNAITHLVYSLILTTLFYIPGLVYTLTNIVNKERRVSYDTSTYIYANPKIAQPSEGTDLDDITNAAKTAGSKIKSGGETVGGGLKSAANAIGSLF
jgi:uncharacterized membrane protein YqaE (UPF0057 family)